ncbi:hypothetical protein RhiJN_22765 [Ceratobasidium sp. AG-Ba]|nr:hypothetical protein RhiJN_22765 [Ceratobasidium sp. AG-Ba]
MSDDAIQSAEDTLRQLVETRRTNDLDAWLAYLQSKPGLSVPNTIHIARSAFPAVDSEWTPGPRKATYMIDCGVAATGNHCVVRLEANSIGQYGGYGGPRAYGTGYYLFRLVLVVADNKKTNRAQTLQGVVQQTWGILVFGFIEDGVGNVIVKFYDKYGLLLAGVKATGDWHLGWIMFNGGFKFTVTDSAPMDGVA